MAAAKRKATELDAVVGRNVRRIREELGGAQDDLAQALRASGWELSASTVIALERGERTITIEEGLLLADVLNVALAELLVSDSEHPFVRLGSLYPEDSGHLTERLREAPRDESTTWAEVQQRRRTMGFGTDTVHAESFARGSLGYRPDDEATREAERHAAERLGTSPDEIVRRSYARWGRTLTEERNARADARVAETMRRLTDEVRRAVARSAEGDARVEERRELALAYAEAGAAEGTLRQRAALRAHVTRELLAELEDEPPAAKEAKRIGGAPKEKGRKQ
jgi:transcriptional regulator with XRE-family HTH domain